jgi:hypothetical protein
MVGGGIEAVRCAKLVQAIRTPIPKEALVPSMKLNGLKTRHNIQIRLLRHLSQSLDGDNYVAITHILPHFQVNNLIFFRQMVVHLALVPVMWSFFCILQQILCNGLTCVTSIFLAVMCKVAVT